tara:strand:+ start:135 stop:413 length:279 start_codon:yes stop_codon:yes gene_type:complete
MEPINEQEERRQQWIDLLKGCAGYHYKKANETAPTIIGQESSEDHILHKVWTIAINDAIGLIELLPKVEVKEEVNVEVDDKKLPQHKEGPLG